MPFQASFPALRLTDIILGLAHPMALLWRLSGTSPRVCTQSAIRHERRRKEMANEPYKPFFLICAHAGIKTGEDGPTHADPQALQLLQNNFPAGMMITLTPWDPQEIWTLVSAALAKRPALIAPFVTRPSETIIDRKALGIAPATEAASGLYLLRKAQGRGGDGTVVLQGSEVGYAFVETTLSLIEKEGVDLNVYYVASAELFDLLPRSEQERIFPEGRARCIAGSVQTAGGG
jgi:transketolase